MHHRLIWILVLAAWFAPLLAGCSGAAAPAATVTPIPTAAAETAAPTRVATGTSAPTRTAVPTETGAPPTSLPTSGTQDNGYPEEVQERIRQVEENLVPVMEIMKAEPQVMTLEGRMAYFNVPGVSIAVINEGKVEWTKGYGELEQGSGRPVTPETLFQAASISKPVTALGTLALASDGVLDLDADVNTWLKGWQAPSAAQPITARMLLSHTAGLSVHGFGGYAPGAELPSAAQILAGDGPANSAAVTLIHEPGSQFDYSGGGYVALQQLMMDATGQDFAALMSGRVFGPLEMTRSLYSPLPADLAEQAAHGHTFDGTPLEGGWRVYPELAPAGLWSTPADLAKVLIEIERADQGQPSAVLDPAFARDMLTVVQENNGLGLVVAGGDPAQMYGHGGSNAGYRTLMFAVRGRGQGAVVMTNADNGMELIFEIFRAIAQTYAWPEVEGWRPGERHRAGFVELDPQVFTGLTGTYQMGALTFTVSAEGEQLLLRIPQDGPAYRLYPDSETEYFTADGAQFIFTLDDTGRATSVKMNGWGEAMEEGKRVP